MAQRNPDEAYANALRRINEAERTGATKLNLSGRWLIALPPEIGNLSRLTVLDVSNNQLTSLPPEIWTLKRLTELNISRNQLFSLPPGIGNLAGLTRLNAWQNQLTSLPPEVGTLKRLVELTVSRNQLTSLPAETGKLTGLTKLYVFNNQLTSLTPEIGMLTGLTELYLANNQLTSLPHEIGTLTHLTKLYVSDNQLTSLPVEMQQLSGLEELYLHGNGALGLPPEVLGPTWEEVLRSGSEGVKAAAPAAMLRFYFARQRDEGTLPLNEAKILVVGEPAVGKTKLVHWLVERKRLDNPEWTKGIKISNWRVKSSDSREPIRVNVWDFGGQEIMQATHQYFLTERSLYILVLDSRQNEEQSRLRHWLERIRTFGVDSPVIVVLNKRDQGVLEPDETRLRQDFPANLKDKFFRTSCEGKGDGVDALREAVEVRLRGLDNVRQAVPKRYMEAKRELEKQSKEAKYLDENDYRRVCEQNKLDATDQDTLLSYLRQLGTLMHHSDKDHREDAVEKTYVLDPDWVTRGMYGILTQHALRDKGGLFHKRELGSFFADHKEYPPDKQRFLLGMMLIKPFELCLELPEQRGQFLVPELLPANEPPHGILPETSLNFQYDYVYLPGGLMPRFIVRMQHHLTPNAYWKYGAVLSFDEDARMKPGRKERGIRALVRASTEERKVFVSVDGSDPRKRIAALTMVRDALAAIHGSMRHLKFEEQVPLPDKPTVTVAYDYLCDLEREEGPDFEFRPQKADRKYKVSELLDGVDETPSRRRRARDDEDPARAHGPDVTQIFNAPVNLVDKHDESRNLNMGNAVGANVSTDEIRDSRATNVGGD
jgi:internalin A